MDFLLDYNISKETIDIINKEEEPSSILYYLSKKDNIIEVLKYLQTINLEVEPLLINRIELFLLPLDLIKRKFSEFNIEVLTKLINDDMNILNSIFFE